MIPQSDTRPSRKLSQARLALLRSAACYAEFALLAKKWTASGIEASLDNKRVGRKDAETRGDGTGKYARYLKGAVPSEKTLRTVTQKYPDSRLPFWALHPIGLLLTDATLTPDAVIRSLETLPKNSVERKLVWDESPQILGRQARREVPDQEENIEALADLRTTQGFLALLGRHRLRQLIGQTDYDDVYEFALLDCFAEVVGSDPHLCLAKQAMIAAFADYLDWQCGWADQGACDPRHAHIERGELWAGISNQIDRAQLHAQIRGDPMPPTRYIEGYAKQLQNLRLYGENSASSWLR